MSLLMGRGGFVMKTSSGTFAGKQGCFSSPAPERVVLWSRRCKRKPKFFLALRKLLIQLWHMSACTQPWELARLLPATITTPQKTCEWSKWSAVTSLPPSPFSHVPSVLSVFQLPPTVHVNCEKKASWFKAPFTSCETFGFLRSFFWEWLNEWPFHCWELWGSSSSTAVTQDRTLLGWTSGWKPNLAFSILQKCHLLPTSASSSCRSILSIKKCLQWRRSAIFSFRPSYIISTLSNYWAKAAHPVTLKMPSLQVTRL